jgi:hypothetical protein
MVALASDNRVTAGEFLIDPPTLINLGFEWFIDGDDNRNASVEVRYRKAGETAWKQALPLLRIGGEEIYAHTFRPGRWYRRENRHSPHEA